MPVGPDQIRRWLRAGRSDDSARNDFAGQVHVVRSRAKRLMAALLLFRPAISDREFRSLKSQIQATAKRLAPQRDQYVVRKTLLEVADHAGASFADWVRQNVPEPGEKPADAQTLDASKAALEKVLGIWPRYDGNLEKLIRKRLKKSRNNARKAFRRAKNDGGIETFHKCRRWSKHLLLQLTFADFIGIPIRQKPLTRLDKLQKRLGSIHDLSISEDYLIDHCRQEDRSFALRDLRCCRSRLERKALKSAPKTIAAKFLK